MAMFRVHYVLNGQARGRKAHMDVQADSPPQAQQALRRKVQGVRILKTKVLSS